MKEVKKNNLKFDEFIMKVNVKHFGSNNLLQDFKFMKNVAEIFHQTSIAILTTFLMKLKY